MPPKKKDHIACANLKGNSIPFLRCIRKQKENVKFWGSEEKAKVCCSCPCEKGKKIKEEQMGKTGVCRNCGQPGSIVADGLTSECYWSVKGLTKGSPEYEAVLTEKRKKYEKKPESEQQPAEEAKKDKIEEMAEVLANEIADSFIPARSLSDLTPRQILERMRDDFNAASQRMAEEGKKLMDEGNKLIFESEDFSGKAQKVTQAMALLEGVL